MKRRGEASGEQGATSAEPDISFEATDAHVRPVVIAGGLLVVGVAICFAVASVLLPPHPKVGPEMSFRHGTENDSSLVRDWRTQDELVREHLEQYGWVDRKTGTARIPIERALELMADQEWHGSPTRGIGADGSETRATNAPAGREKTP